MPFKKHENLACKGGILDKKWSGPYAIDELCGKGLYRLKNESEKILKKKYNSAQLKMYQQRQEHPAAGSDENAYIEGEGGTDFQTERGKESSTHETHVLNDQLYSPSCFGCGEQELMSLHTKQQKMKDLM